MSDRKSDTGGGRAGDSPGRADRLAEALRANLHRRKAQARARRKGAAIAEMPEESGQGSGPDMATETGEDR